MLDEQIRRAGVTTFRVNQDLFRPAQRECVALIPDAVMPQPFGCRMFWIHFQRLRHALCAVMKPRAEICRAVAGRLRIGDDALGERIFGFTGDAWQRERRHHRLFLQPGREFRLGDDAQDVRYTRK